MGIRKYSQQQTRSMRPRVTLTILFFIFALELIRFIDTPGTFPRPPFLFAVTQEAQNFVSLSREQDAKGAAIDSPFSQQQQAKNTPLSISLGSRTATISSEKIVWTATDTVLVAAPGSPQPLAHLGSNFPLAFLGMSHRVRGELWDHVSWSSPTQTWSGWVSAASISTTAPTQSASASFDALSPNLAGYLASFGNNIGAVLYDISHQRYYTYNNSLSFVMASSAKVPIMFAYLDQSEQQGAALSDQNVNELTTMIENSDNDAASDLYSQINTASGMNGFLQKVGITGMQADDEAWGYSTTTPDAMVHLLTMLYNSTILNAQDRAFAFSLLENVEADQRGGVGDTAAPGATVAMKNGWVPMDDGSWAVNTSGIVISKHETYILSVYAQNQSSQSSGQNLLKDVCQQVAASLA